MILSLPSESRVQFEIFQLTLSKVLHSLLRISSAQLFSSDTEAGFVI